LEAVIADARKQGIEEFWHLGDFIGYGPFVDEVVDLLFDTCSQQVIGNYDLRTLKFPKKKDKWKHSKHPEKYIAFKWAWKHLSGRNAKRLKELPQQQTVAVGDLKVLLTHGGPAAVDEAIGPDTPTERLVELASMVDTDMILCGHTHVQFHKTVEEVTFINPGSVGRPEGCDPRAAYAILVVQDEGRFEVQMHRVAYAIERMSQAIQKAGLPDNFATMFETGQNLDQVHDCLVDAHAGQICDYTEQLQQVREFAHKYDFEEDHAEQVTHIARILFKELSKLHKLNKEHLFLLTCAGILHDIGWVQGRKAHHKASMEMILQNTTLPLDDRQRMITALAARYHRRALPKESHPLYPELSGEDRAIVDMLGGIVRVADGLDRSHMAVVKDVTVQVHPHVVEFCCKTTAPARAELLAAQKKADLLEKALGRKTSFISV
jgi:putative phosphoesterase